jgi:hypothetical protein
MPFGLTDSAAVAGLACRCGSYGASPALVAGANAAFRPQDNAECHHIKRVIVNLAVTTLLFGSAGIGAQSATEPLSGLPLAPGFTRTGDPVQSYKYCGKSASIALYVGSGFPDLDHENAWFAHAMPHAIAITSSTGIKTFITPDGTAAVETADAFISYLRFSPGLSPAEMKILGAEPAVRACIAD